MPRIDFYHLQKQSREEVLPKLLDKAYATGKKILVRSSTSEKTEKLNEWLWTYQDESFLPHGTKKDGFADKQPVFLTWEDDNVNHAEFLFLSDVGSVSVEYMSSYERVFVIFDGNIAADLDAARQLWQQSKTAAYEVHYWQQNERGSWEQKA